MKRCGNQASYDLKLQDISVSRPQCAFCYVLFVGAKKSYYLKALVFLMEIDLVHETSLGQCYAVSARGSRHSVRTATLFTLFVVVCRIDSHTLETKSNIP